MNTLFISPKRTIREALSQISKTGQKCLIVVDNKDKLLGTLSDGDARKAILRGSKLDSLIDNVFFKNP